MLKEIFDQPISISNVMGGRISSDGKSAELGGISLTSQEISNLDRINIVGCGSAFYASLIGVFFILRELSDITMEAFRASGSAKNVCTANSLTIGVSQSGKQKILSTHFKKAQIYGSSITSFCNVIGSTMSRLTGNGTYLHAGPEYASSFNESIHKYGCNFALLGVTLAKHSGKMDEELVSEMKKITH